MHQDVTVFLILNKSANDMTFSMASWIRAAGDSPSIFRSTTKGGRDGELRGACTKTVSSAEKAAHYHDLSRYLGSSMGISAIDAHSAKSYNQPGQLRA